MDWPWDRGEKNRSCMREDDEPDRKDGQTFKLLEFMVQDQEKHNALMQDEFQLLTKTMCVEFKSLADHVGDCCGMVLHAAQLQSSSSREEQIVPPEPPPKEQIVPHVDAPDLSSLSMKASLQAEFDFFTKRIEQLEQRLLLEMRTIGVSASPASPQESLKPGTLRVAAIPCRSDTETMVFLNGKISAEAAEVASAIAAEVIAALRDATAAGPPQGQDLGNAQQERLGGSRDLVSPTSAVRNRVLEARASPFPLREDSVKGFAATSTPRQCAGDIALDTFATPRLMDAVPEMQSGESLGAKGAGGIDASTHRQGLLALVGSDEAIVEVGPTSAPSPLQASDGNSKAVGGVTIQSETEEASTTIQRKDERKQTNASTKSIVFTPKQAVGEVEKIAREQFLALEGFVKKPHFHVHSHLFQDAHEMRATVRHGVLHPHDVRKYYFPKGFFATIAGSHWFDSLTLSVVAVNSIWIAVDADVNGSKSLTDKDLIYQLIEYFFVTYFVLEWLVRLLALKRKLDGLLDFWFVFDGGLVVLMCTDTCMALFFQGTGGKTSILRLFRLVKMTKMGRIARLLRKCPELAILIKAIWIAGRSVLSTVFFLIIIAYVFSVAFRFLTMDSAMGEKHFDSVPNGMKNLLLPAVFPDMVDFITDMSEEGFMTEVLAIAFSVLSVMTLMNMLIGILCEVIATSAEVEKEAIRTHLVKEALLEVLGKNGHEASLETKLNKKQFIRLMVKPAAIQVVRDIGVDPVGLLEFMDYIFGEEFGDGTEETQLTFETIIDVVLNLGAGNTATVKDVVDMRKVVLKQLRRIEDALGITHSNLPLTERSDSRESR